MSTRHVSAEHGIVCDMPTARNGYFGWPSVARTEDGTLVVGASGLRFDHCCPWGKTVLFKSSDDGHSWSPPWILNNTPLDDRDCGVISLGGSRLLVSWFASDIWTHYAWSKKSYGLSEDECARWDAVFATWTDVLVNTWLGSWIRTSVDGEAWSDFIRCPVNAPHGPVLLANGTLLYLGRQWPMPERESPGAIVAARSEDGGHTWEELGSVPVPPDTTNENYHEPHVVELPCGRLVGLIRYQCAEPAPYVNFSLFQTESEDGGRTWTSARHLGIYGSPPHLIRHSSGALVCVYSYRKEPLGHRAMISWDDGRSWDPDWILRDDAPPRDHGYPASVEMPDGSIFTVYYQRASHDYKNCGVLWTRWELPPPGPDRPGVTDGK